MTPDQIIEAIKVLSMVVEANKNNRDYRHVVREANDKIKVLISKL